MNNADLAELYALSAAIRGNNVAGYEFAGQAAAIGLGATSVTVGEAVMRTAAASFAQYVLADHRHLGPIPGGLSFEDAAALPTGLLTEHGALCQGGFQPEQTVLITGTSSGIGLLGVHIARALGTGRILATTRTRAKPGLLRDAGADTVLVPGDQAHELTEQVLGATAGEGVDLALDHIGGHTFAALPPATRIGGTVVNIGRLDRAAEICRFDRTDVGDVGDVGGQDLPGALVYDAAVDGYLGEDLAGRWTPAAAVAGAVELVEQHGCRGPVVEPGREEINQFRQRAAHPPPTTGATTPLSRSSHPGSGVVRPSRSPDGSHPG